MLQLNVNISQKKSLAIFLSTRGSIAITAQILTITVGWQMYEVTKSAFFLGLIGLVQFLPMFLLTLVVGYVADRFDRRIIVSVCQAIQCAGVLALAVGSLSGWINKESILLIIFFIGAAYSFEGPSLQALLPNIVSKENFPKAAAASASVFQTATILGPALGGILYSLGAGTVYIIASALLLINCIIIFFVSTINGSVKKEPASIKTIFGGIAFIKSKPDILGAISLDLFAVLFGGATALLPAFADKVLNVGSLGLGFLRSAPAAGALIVSLYLSRRPLRNRVGYKMFGAVAVFGISTIIFALSKSFLLSLIVLAIMGAADVVSVVVRSTLVQMGTPDEIRGRVSSVNMLFIGTSNQLGEFESGVTSLWFGGIVPAVIVGGIGTLVVVFLWMKLFPGLLHAKQY